MTHQSANPKAKVFFALWPTAAESRLLAAWQKALHKLCGGRAMLGETLHNTLVFIGNVELSRLEALQLAAQEVSGQPFELCFDAARYWGQNHIVYAVPAEPPQQLAQLVGTLQQRLAAHGFSFDQRAYQPHVTLLRNARWTDEALPQQMPRRQPVCWQVVDFALVQSVSRNGLAGYEVLARFPLRVG
ncbi:MAG: RNA 2',3'-cyclic phosphodiesterase [Gallionella sp.]